MKVQVITTINSHLPPLKELKRKTGFTWNPQPRDTLCRCSSKSALSLYLWCWHHKKYLNVYGESRHERKNRYETSPSGLALHNSSSYFSIACSGLCVQNISWIVYIPLIGENFQIYIVWITGKYICQSYIYYTPAQNWQNKLSHGKCYSNNLWHNTHNMRITFIYPYYFKGFFFGKLFQEPWEIYFSK